MPKDELFVGYETNFPGTVLPANQLGRQVKIPVFHMLVAGQTQMSGKTTALRALIAQAVAQGYKVLLFDTKSQLSEFEGFGQEVPICLRQTTDSLTILTLVEGIMARKLTPIYATLTKVCENAKDFKQVLENAKVLKSKAKSGFVQDAALTLVDLMTRLIAQTEGKKTVTKLELPYTINKITMNEFDLEAQQMILKTAFEDALHFPKLIAVLDEANKYLPQKFRSVCERSIFSYATQGAITKDFVWISTQFLATTSKDTMKAMDVRLLGRQSHATECEHTIDYIPKIGQAQKLKPDIIMQLKIGHFIVVADNLVKCVYVCPENAERRDCQEVAMGKRKPEDIRYRFSIDEGLYTADEIAKMPKKRFNRRAETREEIKIELPETETIQIQDPKQQENVIETESIEIQKPEQIITRSPPYTINHFITEAEFTEHMNQFEKNILQQLKDLATSPSTNVNLEHIKTKIHVTPVIKHLTVSTEYIRGKLLMLAKEGFFKSWHPLREVVKALEEHNWTADYDAVKHELASLAADQILAMKKAKGTTGENIYSLCPYVEFINGD